MDFLKWLIGGVVGAAIGGAIWVAVGYFLNAEVGYIAWGIGLLAGIGVRVVAGNDEGMMCGVAGVLAAVAIILGAKYMVVSLMMNDALGEVAVGGGEFALTDEDMIASIATEIATEQESQGKSLNGLQG